MKAGIVIDNWKRSIFERHLSQNGYTFRYGGKGPGGVLVLVVDTENANALAEVVKAANTEAAMTGAPQ